ncbi:hypothetical protein FIBSPDRAFT_1048252 [Athelia psychrophila]|uniref:Uncharacterized protein n=1 Tax=Athelia psychrophila TaxID=1759441 RepID=A0A166E2M0_9AGAM|nr:hypothetical protein FIBSPDRAFT_1048252 [Fibularhizoctonia sp. CBS 109695]
MAKNLLPIRILFHSTFALVYLPTIALNFVFLVDVGLISLTALVGLGIFVALDALTIFRKVNHRAFLCIDIFVAFSLPGSQWLFMYTTVLEVRIAGDPIVTTSMNLAAIAIIIGLSWSYLLYIISTAVMDKVRGNVFLPRDLDESPLFSSGARRKVYFIGRQRTDTERSAITDPCASYIFQRSVFRKHAFEPTGWAIFRGIIAVYFCVGLLGFAAYTGYSEGETYANGGAAIQETILPKATVASNLISNDLTSLSVALFSPPSQLIPPDLMVSANWVTGDLEIENTANGSQFWIAYVDTYPWIENNDFNVSWSGDVTLDIWVTVAIEDASPDSKQVGYSPGFTLFPSKEYVIALTIISYEMSGFWWLFLEPNIFSVVDSESTNTTARLTCSWQNQKRITHRILTPPSGLMLFAQALSAIGGLYASIDGVYAFVFGRTMLAILFGSKIISPFGLLGILTRNRLRRLINEQYPHMQEDIKRGGMAAYVSEVAIDPGLVPNSTSAHIRARFAASTQAQASHAGDDAEGAGLIPLRSMEPSNTSGKSSHSQLQLPYAIEDYEPARKHNYE